MKHSIWVAMKPKPSKGQQLSSKVDVDNIQPLRHLVLKEVDNYENLFATTVQGGYNGIYSSAAQYMPTNATV